MNAIYQYITTNPNWFYTIFWGIVTIQLAVIVCIMMDINVFVKINNKLRKR